MSTLFEEEGGGDQWLNDGRKGRKRSSKDSGDGSNVAKKGKRRERLVAKIGRGTKAMMKVMFGLRSLSL